MDSQIVSVYRPKWCTCVWHSLSRRMLCKECDKYFTKEKKNQDQILRNKANVIDSEYKVDFVNSLSQTLSDVRSGFYCRSRRCVQRNMFSKRDGEVTYEEESN